RYRHTQSLSRRAAGWVLGLGGTRLKCGSVVTVGGFHSPSWKVMVFPDIAGTRSPGTRIPIRFRNLSATKRWRRVSAALYTTPMPPPPSFSTTREYEMVCPISYGWESHCPEC